MDVSVWGVENTGEIIIFSLVINSCVIYVLDFDVNTFLEDLYFTQVLLKFKHVNMRE